MFRCWIEREGVDMGGGIGLVQGAVPLAKVNWRVWFRFCFPKRRDPLQRKGSQGLSVGFALILGVNCSN